ncbi:uncharacterized protein LOC101895396 [Musca domestica]|uniref:Uncharacterized protein LOC101895396 n=1 Tax=Musca domestica TaxID=7370 RepID=A0A1I8MMJ8_MUSDO|nr:uncharacterized protein LOC101895396 [Musca domestica]
MKCITVLALILSCTMGSMALVAAPNGPAVVIPTPPPAPTLSQDLTEILAMLNPIQIRQLMTRYLLNDAQFQAFVRIINSQDAFMTYMRFRSQPEVLTFLSWVRTQIMLSGGEFQLEESEEPMTIINPVPFWANTVFGWQGFANEFLLYYPDNVIRTHINMKVAQNGIFTQFWHRLNALKPVYERVIALPEAQRVAAALQKNGIDVVQLDNFIRNQFGWQMPPTLVPSTPVSSVASVEPSVAAPLVPVV